MGIVWIYINKQVHAYTTTWFCSAFYIPGLNMSGRVYESLLVRYGNREGNIDFRDFIACMVRLKTMVGEYAKIIYAT